jgi:hypothetical protein
MLETEAEEWRSALAHNDIAPVRKYIDKLKPELGTSLNTVDEALLGRALLAALAKNSDAQAARLRSEFYPYTIGKISAEPEPIAAPPSVAAPATTPTADFSSKMFSEAWAEAMADNLATAGNDDAKVKWDDGKVAHAGSSLNLWLAIHGDMPLSKITAELAVTFRRMVARLPGSYHREPKWRDWSIKDTIADADREDARGEEADRANYKKIKRVSPKTPNRHISTLKTTWLKFVQLRLVPGEVPNPFDSLHTPVRRNRQAILEERDQFTIKEVHTLFGCSVWTGCRSKGRRLEPGSVIIRDWKYWVPLIGAYTGMRREETRCGRFATSPSPSGPASPMG